jgi:tetratricopeptide (TPR) repeat protein
VARRFRRAIPYYLAALELKQNCNTWINLAIAYRKTNQHEKAIEAYLQSLRFRGGRQLAHHNLGSLYLIKYMLDEAAAHLRKARALNPRDTGTLQILAMCMMDMDAYDNAKAILRRALRLDPNDPALHRQMALALWDKEEPGLAEPHFRRAIELDPTDSQNQVYLAGVLLDLGKTSEATALLERLASNKLARVRRDAKRLLARIPEDATA